MSDVPQSPQSRVVILGGGFGGLAAARAFASLPVSVTLLDRRNFHLFQPLLYQVATGGLSPANIAAPLRSILKHQRNATVLLGEAVDLDVAGRRVLLEDGGALPYDVLVVAAGVRHSYFGKDAWEAFAPGLKTIEDATQMRRRILLAFEKAERTEDASERRAELTFAVVGAGPTGVELAGSLAEIARHTLARDFRRIDPTEARIHLLEAGDRILAAFPPDLAKAPAARSWGSASRWRRERRCSTSTPRASRFPQELAAFEARVPNCSLGRRRREASPLGKALEKGAGAALDRAGRVHVESDCSVPGHPEIFVIGDSRTTRTLRGRRCRGSASPRSSRAATVRRSSARGSRAGRRLRRSATSTSATWRPSGGQPRWPTSSA
jgi:NADH dehydrogenase